MPQTKKVGSAPTGVMRVVIIDNNDIFLNTLKRYIGFYPNLEVVGTAANAEDGLRVAQEVNPDLAFVDLRMPQVSGLTLIAWLREQLPDLCVVAMSLYFESDFARAALQRGVKAFIAKDEITSGLEPLLEKLRETGCFQN